MAREAGEFKRIASDAAGGSLVFHLRRPLKACIIILVQERANPALRAFSTAGATARLTKFTVAG